MLCELITLKEIKMYSFEGEFRRRPQQSFGGASRKVDRKELINKAAEERQQREEARKRIHAATTIQAFFKGTAVRRSEKAKQRVLFNEISKSCDYTVTIQNCSVLESLISKLLFFYCEGEDSNRMIWLTQIVMKNSATITELLQKYPECWMYKLQQLLYLNVRYLKNAITPSTSITVSLRCLEVFTSYDAYANFAADSNAMEICDNTSANMDITKIVEKIWNFLIKKGYFGMLRMVLDNRVPDSLITSVQPPTPLAASLLDLISRPLLVESYSKPFFVYTMLKEVFTEKFSPQIAFFLLPALASLPNAISLESLLSALSSGYSYPELVPSPWLMYTVISIISRQSTVLSEEQIIQYLHILRYLLLSISYNANNGYNQHNGDSGSDDENYTGSADPKGELSEIIKETIQLLNESDHVNALLVVLEKEKSFKESVVSLCCVCHVLLDHHKLAIHNYRLLYTLAFKPSFLRQLWKSIINTCTPSVFGSSAPLLQYLAQGIPLTSTDQERFLPQLTLFCAFLNHLLPTLHDFEFYGDETGSFCNTNMMPFSLPEMASISLTLRDVCMGLIDLAYPETRPVFNEDYVNAMKSVGVKNVGKNTDETEVKRWNQLFKVAVTLLRQLYSRDSRQRFCPEGQWIATQFAISFQRAADLHFSNRRRYGYEPFIGLHPFTREQLEEEGPPPSALEVRQLAVLRELPFVIHFPDRVKIFQSLLTKDKSKNQSEMSNFQMGPQIQVLIRRNYIYEDAFDKLSPENEANLKLKVRVQLVNAIGLDEIGIDGGGIFREFLNELLKTCFDPNRGFFKTTHDRLLYPNPGVHMVLHDFTRHYYFIGRMLGKAIYENMLVELPFAGFFLAKILAQHSSDVDIHHLASLDPVMYKNLLYLKTYDGDVSDLGLDFTVMCSELGENEVIELKPGGTNIPVTENNRITYIHLMADYKLNKQIRTQCQAFKEGLADVIDLEWLYMFDPNELQILISGAHTPIDIEDLKVHTNYAGGYTPEHSVIQAFWRVVENFNERQRRQLLKFVTSCSRPPLLGFKELAPAFCIQNAGSEPERLPTASTCMNLLKLPEFHDEKTLKLKLLYAIESGAGFELS